MDHTNFPLAKPIPIETLKTFEDSIDWDEFYGRWGTETSIYSDFYSSGCIPEHLINKVSHVWMYIEK